MPRGWEEALAAIAYTFHPPFGDLWAMDVDELRFWQKKAAWINERLKRRG